MAPPVASAKLTLSYPIYAADFDPRNNGFLVVAGGGGEGRSGVGNKITLIDTSRKHEISEVVDVDLSRDEDSVTSLAVARSSDSAAVVYAGINSASAEQQTGKNEHLRSFKLAYPPRKLKDEKVVELPETQALGKVSLFNSSTASRKETYQRVLKLSRTRSNDGAKIGAIATGLAPAGEVIVFNATEDSPGPGDVRKRIQLSKGEEAADVDLIESKDGGYLVAYCTDYDVYVCNISSELNASNSEPRFVHGTPHPDVFATAKARPTFRSLRFLTPNLMLLLQNLPSRSGSQVLLLEVPDSAELGSILLYKVLPKSIKSASALATALLPASKPTQNIQHTIAIAGQDISITILTLDHSPSNFRSLKFRTHTVLRGVHPLQMTALAFSTFSLPSDLSTAQPQYLKLASASMSSTVIVHTFPLTPYPSPSSDQKTPSRYVLQRPGAGETAQMSFSIIVSIIVVAIGAFLLQAWTEIRGGTPEYLGAKGWLSQRVHDYIALPYMFDDVHSDFTVTTTRTLSGEVATGRTPDATGVKQAAHDKAESILEKAEAYEEYAQSSLRRLLDRRHLPGFDPHSNVADDIDDPHFDSEALRASSPPPDTILVLPQGASVSASLHADEDAAAQKGKPWDELSEEQKALWKERLVSAGEWAVDEGETVLKSVFFGQIGGVVGGVVGGMMGGG